MQALSGMPSVWKPPNAAYWQELGFWHIGRAQIMSGKYGVEEYWHNDMANDLRINHLDMTLQPVFVVPPKVGKKDTTRRMRLHEPLSAVSHPEKKPRSNTWEPMLGLERLHRPVVAAKLSMPGQRLGLVPPPPMRLSHPVGAVSSGLRLAPKPVTTAAVVAEDSVRWDQDLGLGPATAAPAPSTSGMTEDIGSLSFTFDEPPAPVAQSSGGRKGGRKKGAAVGGSLLKADGTSEASMVGML